MKRVLPAVVSAAFLATIIAGCGASTNTNGTPTGTQAGGGTPAPAQTGPVQGGIVHLAYKSDLPHLDPAQVTDTESIQMIQMMYEPLLTFSPKTTDIIPSIADHWDWSNGGKTIKLHINDKAKFADGAKVTADDVVYSFNHLLDPKTKAGYGSFYTEIHGTKDYQDGKAKSLAGVTKVDDSTVQFDLDDPSVWFLNALALPAASIQEKKLVDGKDTAFYDGASAGSGPFTLKSWTKGQGMVMLANKSYWRKGEKIEGYEEGPFIDEIDVAVKVDDNNEFLQFQKGSLELAAVAPATYLQVQQDDKWKALYHHNPAVGIYYFGLNTELPPFNNPKVREAFNYAVDKAAVLKAANNRGVVAEGVLPPGMPGYDETLKPIQKDSAKAKQLLTDAKFDFNQTITLVHSDREIFKKIAEVIQQNLQEAGVKVELKPESWDVFLTDVGTPKKVQAFILDWYQDYPDPQDFVGALFNSASAVDQGNNGFWYKNKAVDDLQAKADADTNKDSRATTYKQIQKMIDADYPWVPLYYPWDNILKQPTLLPEEQNLYLHPILQPQLDKMWLKK